MKFFEVGRPKSFDVSDLCLTFAEKLRERFDMYNNCIPTIFAIIGENENRKWLQKKCPAAGNKSFVISNYLMKDLICNLRIRRYAQKISWAYIFEI